MITGPAAVRLAVLAGTGSLTAFGYVLFALNVDTSLYLALSAALFVLAITLWIGAYLDERATRDAFKVGGRA